jgi:hypothetical protein
MAMLNNQMVNYIIYPCITAQKWPPSQVGLKLLQHQIHSADQMLWSHLMTISRLGNLGNLGNAAFSVAFPHNITSPWLWNALNTSKLYLGLNPQLPTFSSRGIPFSSSSRGLKTPGATGAGSNGSPTVSSNGVEAIHFAAGNRRAFPMNWLSEQSALLLKFLPTVEMCC